MKTAADFILSDTLRKLQRKFPGMAAFAKEVEVIPWQDEFNVADKNPEVIDAVEYLNMLLERGSITQEQYEEEQKKLAGYASKTVAIAFIEKRQVSFRDPKPSSNIVLHELGHIYFQVNDLFWSTRYGGGEILLHLALNNRYHITEEHIRRYHGYLEQVYENPEGIHRVIANTIAPHLGVFPHLFPICLSAGYIPDFDIQGSSELLDDLKSTGWAEIEVRKNHLFSFFQYMTEGLKYADSFWIKYAEWLKVIEECPVCGRIVCCCD